MDIVRHLSRSQQAVGGCSLRPAWKLRDACLEETLAAFLCECQLLLCCTSRPVIDVSLCCVRHERLSGSEERPINQSWKPRPLVKHRKASFVSSQFNQREAWRFQGQGSTQYVLFHLSWRLSPTSTPSKCASNTSFIKVRRIFWCVLYS